jgi:hypothetical protein
MALNYTEALANPNQLVREYTRYLDSRGERDPRTFDKLTYDLGRQLEREGRLEEYFKRYPDFQAQYEVFAPAFRPTLTEKFASGLKRATGTFLAEIPAGIMEGAAVIGQTVTGSETPVSETALYRGAQGIRGAAAERFPVHEDVEGDFWWDQVPGAIGSFGAFIAGSIATGAIVGATTRGVGLAGRTASAANKGQQLNQAAEALRISNAGRKAAMGFSLTAATTGGMGRSYTEANQFGVSEEDARLAGMWGSVPGAIQVFPVIRAFDRFNRGSAGQLERSFQAWITRKGGPDVVAKAIPGGMAGAVEEWIVESLGQVGFNAIAQQIYDNDREYLLGVAEAGGAGGIAGFLANALLSAVGGGKSGAAIRRGVPPAEAPDADSGSPDRIPTQEELKGIATGRKKAPDLIEKIADMTPQEGLARYDELTAKAKRTTEENAEWRLLDNDERVQAQIQARQEGEERVLSEEPTEIPTQTGLPQQQPGPSQPGPVVPVAEVAPPATLQQPPSPRSPPAEQVATPPTPTPGPPMPRGLAGAEAPEPTRAVVEPETPSAQQPSRTETPAEDPGTDTAATPPAEDIPSRPFAAELGPFRIETSGESSVLRRVYQGAMSRDGNRSRSRNYLIMQQGETGRIFAVPVGQSRKNQAPFKPDGSERYSEQVPEALGAAKLIGLERGKHAAVSDLVDAGYSPRMIFQFERPGNEIAVFDTFDQFQTQLPQGVHIPKGRIREVFGQKALDVAQIQQLAQPETVSIDTEYQRILGSIADVPAENVISALAEVIDSENTPAIFNRIQQRVAETAEPVEGETTQSLEQRKETAFRTELAAIIQEAQNELTPADGTGTPAQLGGEIGTPTQRDVAPEPGDTGHRTPRIGSATARSLAKFLGGAFVARHGGGRLNLDVITALYDTASRRDTEANVRRADNADKYLNLFTDISATTPGGIEYTAVLDGIQSAFDRSGGDPTAFAEELSNPATWAGDTSQGTQRGRVSPTVRDRPATPAKPRQAITSEQRQAFRNVISRLQNGGVNIQQLQQDIGAVDAFLRDQNAAIEVNPDQRGYTITMVMEDVANANFTNLVAITHEAAHIAIDATIGTMDTQTQDAAWRAVNKFTQESFKNTPEPGTYYANPEERLAEHLGRKLAEEGFGARSASLGQRIIRMVKELYYRVALSIQKAIYGPGNVSGDLALRYAENQLRRMLGGDQDGGMNNFLKYIGADIKASPGLQAQTYPRYETNTPIDRFDPITQRFTQPEVLITDGEVFMWDKQFVHPDIRLRPAETDGERAIMADESRARWQSVASKEVLEFADRLYADYSTKYSLPMDKRTWMRMWTKQNPAHVLETAERNFPESTEATWDRLTESETNLANEQAVLGYMEAKATVSKSIHLTKRQLDAATNKLIESKKRSDALHNDINDLENQVNIAKEEMRGMMRNFLAVVQSGQSLTAKNSKMEQMIRDAEMLSRGEKIPAGYTRAIEKWFSKRTEPFFSALQDLAALKLDFEGATTQEVLDAMRASGKFENMTKEDVVLLAVMAVTNHKQMDLLQLRTMDPREKLAILGELNNMRRMSRKQLLEMQWEIGELRVQRDIKSRLKRKYWDEAKKNRRISESIAELESRINMLEELRGDIWTKWHEFAERVDMGILFEAIEGATFPVPFKNKQGEWEMGESTLRFNTQSEAHIRKFQQDKNSLAMWLAQKKNEGLQGTREYRNLEHVFNKILGIDLARQYPAHHRVWLERWFQPTWEQWANKGGIWGFRIAQRGQQAQVMLRKHIAGMMKKATLWSGAEANLMNALDIQSIATFREMVGNVINHRMEVESALTIEQLTDALAPVVNELLPPGYQPKGRFHNELKAYITRTKEISDAMANASNELGNLVESSVNIDGLDASTQEMVRLYRRTLQRGIATIPRVLQWDTIRVVTQRMSDAGWDNAEMVGNAANMAFSPDAGESGLGQEAINTLFTDQVIESFVEPFIRKPGEPVFHDLEGTGIPQSVVEAAWDKSDRNILTFIETLFNDYIPHSENADEAAGQLNSFATKTVRRLDGLRRILRSIAAENESNPSESKTSMDVPRVIMDARVSDIMPPQFLAYAAFDQTHSRIMLETLVFHSAFGRNGEGLKHDMNALYAELKDARDYLVKLKRDAADNGIRGIRKVNKYIEERLGENGRQQRVQLERKTRSFEEFNNTKKYIDDYYSRGNQAGPFRDQRVLLELTGLNSAMVLGQPRSGIKQFSSLLTFPIAYKGINPDTGRMVVESFSFGARDVTGSLFRAFGVDLLRQAEDGAIVENYISQREMQHLPWGAQRFDNNIVHENGISGRIIQNSRWFKRMIRGKNFQIRRGEFNQESDAEYAPISWWFFDWLNARSQHAMTMANLRFIKRMLIKSVRFMEANPDIEVDTAYRIKAEDVGMKGRGETFEQMKLFLQEYGMDFEQLARSVKRRIELNPSRESIMEPDEVMRVAQMTLDKISLEPSLSSRPGWMFSNPVLQAGSVLMGWGLSTVNQFNKAFKTVDGQRNLGSALKGMTTVAMWSVPAGIAFSMLLDIYDERILDKRSNIRPIDWQALLPGGLIMQAVGLAGDKDPKQNIFAALERLTSAGVYGIGMDIANSTMNIVDPQAGQRDFSLDSRVLILNQLGNIQNAIKNMIHQDGDVTYASVVRPLAHTFLGNGVIQNQQILANAFNLDTNEARMVTRINANNWLRAAAREHDIELRLGGARTSPTPVSVRVREMQLAAYAGDRESFLNNYRLAVQAEMRRSGATYDEARGAVLRSWKMRHPLIATFRRKPSDNDYRRMLGSMSERGRASVRDVVRQHERFTEYLEAMRNPSPVVMPLAVGM